MMWKNTKGGGGVLQDLRFREQYGTSPPSRFQPINPFGQLEVVRDIAAVCIGADDPIGRKSLVAQVNAFLFSRIHTA
jgi:hypothetical protein